jgi:hypothetical protein
VADVTPRAYLEIPDSHRACINFAPHVPTALVKMNSFIANYY